MIDEQEIIHRLKNGETMTNIAAELHCRYEKVQNLVKRHLSSENYNIYITKGHHPGSQKKRPRRISPERQSRVKNLTKHYDRIMNKLTKVVLSQPKKYPIQKGHQKKHVEGWINCLVADRILETT